MRIFLKILSAALLAGLPAGAAQLPFDGSWKEQGFSLLSSNDYTQNGQSLSVVSDGTVSLLYKRLPQGAWGATSASWGWSVSEGVPATNLRRKGGDDRDLAVYFVFTDTENARAIQNQSLRRLMSNDKVRVLVYVWGGDRPVGTMQASPYLGERGVTVIRRGAGTGEHRESVDLAGDLKGAFGTVPGALVGVAISADSDDTDGRIRASVSNLDVN